MLLASLAAPAALDLLPYYDRPPVRRGGVVVRAGMVGSVDGTAVVDGRTALLSTPADKAVFRLLRALSDVILVGAGTARAEDYGPPSLADDLVEWRRDAGLSAQPRLAVVSRSGDLDPSARLFSGAPPLVLVPADVAADIERRLAGRADVVGVPDGRQATGAAGASHAGDDAEGDGLDGLGLLAALRGRDLVQVLCEGGPALLGRLLRAGVVDELCCTVSPLLVGGGDGMVRGALAGGVAARLRHCLEVDGTLLLRYDVDPGDPGDPGDGLVGRAGSART